MIHLKKYDPADTYMAPVGALMDAAAVAKQFPAASVFTHVVSTDEQGEVMYGLFNLSAMRTQYGIDAELEEADAITALEAAMIAEQEAQAEAAAEPTADERIAAMLEYQVLMSL